MIECYGNVQNRRKLPPEDVEVSMREMKETINFQSGKPRGDTQVWMLPDLQRLGTEGQTGFTCWSFDLSPGLPHHKSQDAPESGRRDSHGGNQQKEQGH